MFIDEFSWDESPGWGERKGVGLGVRGKLSCAIPPDTLISLLKSGSGARMTLRSCSELGQDGQHVL